MLSLYFCVWWFLFPSCARLGYIRRLHPATSNIWTLHPAPRWQIRPWLVQPRERLEATQACVRRGAVRHARGVDRVMQRRLPIVDGQRPVRVLAPPRRGTHAMNRLGTGVWQEHPHKRGLAREPSAAGNTVWWPEPHARLLEVGRVPDEDGRGGHCC